MGCAGDKSSRKVTSHSLSCSPWRAKSDPKVHSIERNTERTKKGFILMERTNSPNIVKRPARTQLCVDLNRPSPQCEIKLECWKNKSKKTNRRKINHKKHRRKSKRKKSSPELIVRTKTKPKKIRKLTRNLDKSVAKARKDNYKCVHCLKSFRRGSILRNHLRSHEGKKIVITLL